MTVLHLLSNPNATASCLAALDDADALLLLADGVFALAAITEPPEHFAVVREDAMRRGVKVHEAVPQLSYADFVDWIVAYDTSVTWR